LGCEIALFVVLAGAGLWIAYRALHAGGNAGTLGEILLWWAVTLISVSIGAYCALLAIFVM
jgi:multisubunit Na+/H+ antiporter MnhG subunit